MLSYPKTHEFWVEIINFKKNFKKIYKNACKVYKIIYNTHHLADKARHGAVAQSGEQRIENPCVGSSILPHATIFSDTQL